MKTTKELAEFEALVEAICDKCPQDCRQRLLIMDLMIQRQEKALRQLDVIVEALTEIIVQNHPDSFQKQLNELTLRILQKPKEPPNEQDKDLSEKLTDWH